MQQCFVSQIVASCSQMRMSEHFCSCSCYCYCCYYCGDASGQRRKFWLRASIVTWWCGYTQCGPLPALQAKIVRLATRLTYSLPPTSRCSQSMLLQLTTLRKFARPPTSRCSQSMLLQLTTLRKSTRPAWDYSLILFRRSISTNPLDKPTSLRTHVV